MLTSSCHSLAVLTTLLNAEPLSQGKENWRFLHFHGLCAAPRKQCSKMYFTWVYNFSSIFILFQKSYFIIVLLQKPIKFCISSNLSISLLFSILGNLGVFTFLT